MHTLALVLYGAGVAVLVLTSLAAVLVRDVLTLVHLLSPATSVGVPLVALGLSVQNGWSLTTGSLLLTAALLAVSGPVLATATARVEAQERDLVDGEEPE